jgi:hypothetical protein
MPKTDPKPEAHYDVGQSFQVQFIWRLPDKDFIRAIFRVEVLLQDDVSDKYVVRLNEFVAGRQETAAGETRDLDQVARGYWALVDGLVGRRISLAYEVDDGRPLWLRLDTLTGEHNFFRRLNELPPELAAKLQQPEE